jgi:hypothetical protein
MFTTSHPTPNLVLCTYCQIKQHMALIIQHMALREYGYRYVHKYQARAACLWPVATVAGANTHYICMKKICYEYEVGGGLNHTNSTHLLHQGDPLSGPRRKISGCGGILMTTSHSSRCWNTLYMYEVDLLWVWMVWEASIITYSLQHDTSEKPSDYPTPLSHSRY